MIKMIKTYIFRFIALFTIVSVIVGTVSFMSYGLKLAMNNPTAYIIILLFTAFSIIVSFLLTAQQNVFKTVVNEKLSNNSDKGSGDTDFDYSNVDVDSLEVKTTDLTLTEYYYRSAFVENSGSSEGILAVIEYLRSRVVGTLPYEDMPLPVVAAIIKKVDNNLPESTLNILHDSGVSKNDTTDEFSEFKDIDTESIH